MKNYDVVVIGGGPGGGAAAQQANLRGSATCLIEANNLGGSCLSVGCIPTKAMLHTSELRRQISRADEFGLRCGEVAVDGAGFMKRVHDVVGTIVKGLDSKYQTNDIDLFRGLGRLVAPNRIEIELNDGATEQIEARSIIIATGSAPIRPEIFPWDSPRVMTTDEALTAQTLPQSVLIVGGGVIGCEFATIYSELGIPTTLIEMLERLSPALDEDVSKLVQRSLRRRKVDVHLRSKIVEMTADDTGIKAETEDRKVLEASCALIAIGRKANIEGIGLDKAGVEVKDGIIAVDEHCRTNVPHIYAIGDVAEGRQYAHLAARMGIVAGDNATGLETTDDRTVVPVGQFTHPEVGAVGLSEARAKQQYQNVRVASVQYQGTGTGWAYGEREGLVKIIADADTGRIYGGLIIGYRAAETIQELTLAMRQGLTVRTLAETIHVHPTFVEAIGFAAEAWVNQEK